MFKNFIFVISAFLVTGCQYMPDIAKSVDDILTDGVLLIQLDKDAFKEKVDTLISVEIVHNNN
jgi:hypothetical protein